MDNGTETKFGRVKLIENEELLYVMDDNGKLLVEVIIVTLDAVATVNVLKANNNDVNLVNSRTVNCAWPVNRRLVLIE